MVALLLTGLASFEIRAAAPTNWTTITLKELPSLSAVHHGNGLWVAIGGTRIYTSADAQTWKRASLGRPGDDLRDVHYGNGAWVAVGWDWGAEPDTGLILTSTDGKTWTRRNTAPNNGLNAVVYGNGTWVIVGGEGTWPEESGLILTSTDSVVWQRCDVWIEHYLEAVHYGDGTWMAVTRSYAVAEDSWRNDVWISSDSQRWTRAARFEDGSIERLHCGNGIWLAAGWSILASVNGYRWTPMLTPNNDGVSIAYGDDLWAVAGTTQQGHGVLLTSPDTRQWQTHTMGSLPKDIHYADGRWVVVCGNGLVLTAAASKADVARMAIELVPEANGLQVSCTGPSNHVYRLQQSANLKDWQEVAVADHCIGGFPVRSSADAAFFRAVLTPFGLKHQIQSLGDPFLSPPAEKPWEQSRWIKFLILLDEPDQVYFQDSSQYLFHYEFAREQFARFAGLSAEEFNHRSLYQANREVVLGAVIFPPDPLVPEIGIQFVGYDRFPPQQIAQWFRLVQSRISAAPQIKFFYLPVFEQDEAAQGQADFFAAQGIAVSSADRWAVTDQCYSRGWTLGRLVHLAPQEIAAAYAAGRLQATDILLLDAVPGEVPPVAGIVTLTPATPNSHVAILAQSFGIPFGYVADLVEQQQFLQWAGRDILLMVYPTEWGGEVSAVNAAERLALEHRQRLQELKRPSPIALVPKQAMGTITVSTAGLVPDDIRYVGGKAANFGVLVRSLPEHTQTEAIAFTFDLWDQFLNQVLVSGKSLRQTIQERLNAHRYPPNLAALSSDLAAIRQLITQEAEFSSAQQQAVLAALAGFDPHRKIRFRSSTNVEDAERFSGAGLYDSYSGCLADDLDGDTRGPSQCDPTEANERGVLRAMKKVYASFYNDNAFLERLRHGIDEAEVGMGLLVHYSFPDEIEWANGVATLKITRAHESAARTAEAELVTQAGAVSVANPEANAAPEVVRVQRSGSAVPTLTRQQQSGLVLLGATVLALPADYETLFGLLDRAAQAYCALFPDKTSLTLDFEYKKIAPGRLVVKQVREIPQTPKTAPLVVCDMDQIVVFQYSYTGGGDLPMDLFSNHRLKSAWMFRMSPLDLDLVVEVTYRDGDTIKTVTGPFRRFSEAQFKVEHDRVVYSWRCGEGETSRIVRLNLAFPYDLAGTDLPLVFLSDAVMELRVEYATPQPFLPRPYGWGSGTEEEQWTWGTRTNEVALLEPLERLKQGARAASLSFTVGRMSIVSDYDYWSLFDPDAGRGQSYRSDFLTEALAQFKETHISGLVSQPIVLRSDFSQSYATMHHNYRQDFLFEPDLEPGIDPGLLTELRAANIKAVILSVRTWDDPQIPGEVARIACERFNWCSKPLEAQVRLLGFDGTLRTPEP